MLPSGTVIEFFKVLILIVLDYGHWVGGGVTYAMMWESLNPYCVGLWSLSKVSFEEVESLPES